MEGISVLYKWQYEAEGFFEGAIDAGIFFPEQIELIKSNLRRHELYIVEWYNVERLFGRCMLNTKNGTCSDY